jgi:hypothetical protein
VREHGRRRRNTNMLSPTVTERRTALEPTTRDDFADPPAHPATAVRGGTGHRFVHLDRRDPTRR